MTPEQKEHWRWTYAGQIYAALIVMPRSVSRMEGLEIAIGEADRLIAELEKREQEECDHKVFIPVGTPMPVLTECPKCGKKFDITPSQEPCEHEWDSNIGACRKCGMDVFDEQA